MTRPFESKRTAGIVRACRAMEKAEAPSVAAMARVAGMSRGNFQRSFREMLGITPGEFLRSRRAEAFRCALDAGLTVTAAALEAGFGSSSRVHQAAGESLGMAPSNYRRGAPGEIIRFAAAPCSLGKVLVAATGRGLCAVMLGDDEARLAEALAAGFPRARLAEGDGEFRKILSAVVRLIEVPGAVAADLPLDIRGTAFQRRAWRALQQIPAGETITYAELARRMGRPDAIRAAASACGANPLAVVIPCHRVVRADGNLSGYRWGVERKRRLLEKEGSRLMQQGPRARG